MFKITIYNHETNEEEFAFECDLITFGTSVDGAYIVSNLQEDKNGFKALYYLKPWQVLTVTPSSCKNKES